MPRQRAGRRAAALVLAAVAVAGLGTASASQLTVGSRTLQAGSAVVGGCQPAAQAVTASFTSAFSSGAYRTTSVRVANVAAACVGRTYRLQLVDATGAPLGADRTGTVAFSGGALVVTVPSTPTASIASVALVMGG